MNKPLSFLIKLSGLPAQYVFFKKKIYTEDNKKEYRKIKGPALIISNHTSVYDYPLIMYTFFSRNIRTLISESMYEHSRALNRLLNHLGGIKVDRKSYNFNFLTTMSNCLKKKQVGLIFPESRLHTKDDPKGLLPFAPSYVYLALMNNVPIIPIYTNGIYGKLKKQNKDRARLIIGKPIIASSLIDKSKSEKENINYINNYVKEYIIKLGNILSSMK